MAFSHVGAVVKGGLHCGSVWLKHVEGLTEDNMAILQVISTALTKLKGPWVLGGDWNVSPDTLVNSGWVESVGGMIYEGEDM